jgi:hypothetical protein
MAGMCHLTHPELITNGIVRPAAYDPLLSPSTQLANVMDQLSFYARLTLLLDVWTHPVMGMAGPGVFGLPRTPTEKAPYKIAYEGSINVLHTLLTSILSGHTPAVAGAVRSADFVPRPNNFQKLALYDGENEVKLSWWRPLVEEQVAQTMPNATPQAKAHMIHGSLGAKVLGHMANQLIYDSGFWSDPARIWVELEALYVKPNQGPHALQKLRLLTMNQLQLSKYHKEYTKLCTLANVNPDAPAHLMQFFDGLNNEATRGGLKNQVADLKVRVSDQSFPLVTATDVFRRCDLLISTDSGTDTYENTGKRPWVPKGNGNGNGGGNGNQQNPRGNRRGPQSNVNQGNPKAPKTKRPWVARSGAQDPNTPKDTNCFRCGRTGHMLHECVASKHAKGHQLTSPKGVRPPSTNPQSGGTRRVGNQSQQPYPKRQKPNGGRGGGRGNGNGQAPAAQASMLGSAAAAGVPDVAVLLLAENTAANAQLDVAETAARAEAARVRFAANTK